MQSSEASAAVSVFDYPEAERLDLIDDIHGTPVADPYRWLEDPHDPRTIEWGEQQDLRYSRWLGQHLGLGGREAPPASGADLPAFAEGLRGRLAELAGAGSVSVPVWRGEQYFIARRAPGREHPVICVVAADGAERELIDPAALDPSGATTLDGWFPSADGALLAYFLSVGGTERPRLQVMAVAGGGDIDAPIDAVAGYALAWLPNGAGFYYQRRPTAEQIAEGVLRVHLLVYLHRIGTPSSTDVLISRPERGLPASSWFTPVVSADGRWLRLDAEWGMTRNDVYLADLTACEPEAPVFTDLKAGPDAKTEVFFGHDGRIYAHTFAGAPNGRLCVIDPHRLEYEHWHTLLPEDPGAVLKGFAILDGEGMRRPRLLALRARHALSELTFHDPDTGEPTAGSAVELPGLGTVCDLAGDPGGGPFAYFTYTDFRTPPNVYRLDGRSGVAEQWTAVPGVHTPGADAELQVAQVGYTSHDGTEVRMFVLSPTGRADRPRPAILHGYGSHGISRVPAFNPLQVAWVEAGGVYAIANIRGGGEEGEAWHRAGMRENRHNTFADFHAAGDHLVEQGWTTRDQLGIHGGSAGGRLVGVALTQRPEAYRAVLCSAPPLDMIRIEQSGAGAAWVGENGSVSDPEQFGWLLAQSPYHMLHEGTAYPALLLTVFDGDSRVPTWHASKFAAAIQRATTASPLQRPILLRREAGVGHSARAVSRSIALWSEQLGFLAVQLGLIDAEPGPLPQPAEH